MRDTIDMAREAGLLTWLKPPEDVIERFKAFEALVRADERTGCAEHYLGIMRNAVADAVQAEREACAKFFDLNDTNLFWGSQAAKYIRARSLP
jgi:hypothetical protein